VIQEDRRPLYALLIAPDEEERKKIISGEKTATIRTGRRNYNIGTVMLCCHIDPWVVMASIKEVKYCELNLLEEEELNKCGYESVKDAVKKLQKFYPKIEENSYITMITWDNVRGSLVCKK